MRKKFYLFCSIIVLLFFISYSNIDPIFDVCSQQQILTSENPISNLHYVEHAPIAILNDNDFETYGFPGSGNASDPYIIENLNISSHPGEIRIEIRETTKHFIIRNCFLKGGSIGIYLYRLDSNTTVISNNTCSNNDLFGIYVHHASQSLIINNTCSNNV